MMRIAQETPEGIEARNVLGELYALLEGRPLTTTPLDVVEGAIRTIERALGVEGKDPSAAGPSAEAASAQPGFSAWLESKDPYAAQMLLFRKQQPSRRTLMRAESADEEEGEEEAGAAGPASKAPERIVVDHTNAAEYAKKTFVYAHRTNAPTIVYKEWGESKGEPGDYVIVGQNDDVYICNAELFEQEYEKLPGSENRFKKVGRVLARRIDHDFTAETNRGLQEGKAGDYLVQNSSGEQWTIDAKTFDETYEEVSMASHARALEGMLNSSDAAPVSFYDPSMLISRRTYTGREDPALVTELLQTSTRWEFDVFAFEDATHGHALSRLGSHFFHGHDLLQPFEIREEVLANFLQEVEAGYLAVPYHNRVHGADVLQATNHFVVSTSLDVKFSQLEKLSLLVAAMVHDLGHPGTNNLFQIQASTAFALFYNDESVLENFHVASCFQIMRRKECSILQGMERPQYVEARRMIIAFVLATDFAKHKKFLDEFDRARRRGGSLESLFGGGGSALQRGTRSPSRQGGSGLARAGTGASLHAKESGRDSVKAVFGNSPEDRLLIGQVTIKCADVSHPARKRDLHVKWTDMVTIEFASQVTKETQLGLPVSMRVSREPKALAQSQLGFIKFLVAPLFKSYSEFHDNTMWMALLNENLRQWEEQANAPDAGAGAEEEHKS